jgi:hypothetical protein
MQKIAAAFIAAPTTGRACLDFVSWQKDMTQREKLQLAGHLRGQWPHSPLGFYGDDLVDIVEDLFDPLLPASTEASLFLR